MSISITFYSKLDFPVKSVKEVTLLNRISGVEFGQGVYHSEKDIEGVFYWTQRDFQIVLQSQAVYYYLLCNYLGDGGTLSCLLSDGHSVKLAKLRKGWQEITFEIPNSLMAMRKHRFIVEPAIQVTGDPREFGICIRRLRIFASIEEFQKIARRIANSELNRIELHTGQTYLRSTPPRLRIDMEVRCNMEPKCVYCSWDYTKELEAGNIARMPFSKSFFDDLGEYYEHAVEIVNCSHGEVLLSPYFAGVVNRLDKDGKHFEFTTNGILLNETMRSLILGKDIFIYISLDAATPECFSRYRNDQFELIVENIRRLCRAKRNNATDFPKVFLSYILMRSNVSTVENFLDLADELGVDAVVFKTLDDYDNTHGIPQRRNGFEFDYHRERLSRTELQAEKESIVMMGNKRHARQFFTFATEDKQFWSCEELWQSVYIMERGFVPCCISRRPAVFNVGGESLSRKQQIEVAVNSKEFQAMRADFASGSVPQYCFDIDCPHIRGRGCVGQ